MEIYNLTREQVEMLDKLWEFETLEEIETFKRTLTVEKRQQVNTLMELLKLQAIDNSIDEIFDVSMGDLVACDLDTYPLAGALLKPILKK